ncbi:hypothetical protein LXL04_003424 [Taraxacum kok-saghyz]
MPGRISLIWVIHFLKTNSYMVERKAFKLVSRCLWKSFTFWIEFPSPQVRVNMKLQLLLLHCVNFYFKISLGFLLRMLRFNLFDDDLLHTTCIVSLLRCMHPSITIYTLQLFIIHTRVCNKPHKPHKFPAPVHLALHRIMRF